MSEDKNKLITGVKKPKGKKIKLSESPINFQKVIEEINDAESDKDTVNDKADEQ